MDFNPPVGHFPLLKATGGIESKHFDLLLKQTETLSVGFKSAMLGANAVREENFPDPPLEAGDPSHSARPSGQQTKIGGAQR